tara:strand:+ start:524 stop:1183 length:660 start_codon:yes stop_codon:yes gene_type:complete
MSNLKDLFQDIKNVFKEEGIETDTEVKVETSTNETNTDEVVTEKFEDIVLEDGTVAQVEPGVSVGSAVVVAVDDELLPAPDGEHLLSDGRKIVTESGVIVSVEEAEEMPEVEEEVVEEEEMETEKPFTEAQEREAKKIIESIVTERVFSMETTITVDNEELKKQVEKLTTAFNGLLELTEKLITEPTKETIKKSKSGFAKLKTNKRDIIEVLKSKNIIN